MVALIDNVHSDMARFGDDDGDDDDGDGDDDGDDGDDGNNGNGDYDDDDNENDDETKPGVRQRSSQPMQLLLSQQSRLPS